MQEGGREAALLPAKNPTRSFIEVGPGDDETMPGMAARTFSHDVT